MNPPKITYLIGAGASKYCIPLAKELSGDIADITERINHLVPDHDDYFDSSGNKIKTLDVYGELRKNLINLSEEARKHASVDTLAKKKYLTDPDDRYKRDFNLIKTNLSAYFAIKQLIQKPDPRYDAFFASILEEEYTNLPSNINIISWNYDKQYEIVYSEYDNNSISSASRKLNVISKFSRNKPLDSKFQIFKLNGTAGYLDRTNDHGYLWDKNDQLEAKKSFKHILNVYYHLANYSKFNHSALSFAWENDHSEKSITARAIESAISTSILIIIGYSFPFFNRKIDKQILDSMSPDQIYIQDLVPADIESKIKIISPKYSHAPFIQYPVVDQFLVPFQL